MTIALDVALAQVAKLAPYEQDALASILLKEISSEQRWAASFAASGDFLESLAAEAIADWKAGKSQPLTDIL